MVRVAVAAPPLVRVTEDGEGVQVTPGAAVQARLTLPANPFVEDM
jgi:hypothetical protein